MSEDGLTATDAAIATLYRAPLAAFVAERKRLAAELKTAGDRDGAARVAKLGKPTASTWTVNQLHWRGLLGPMFATAARLRAGDLAATAEHRDAIASLRARAAELLAADGHGATEAVLRRITTTLAALAATGSFAPDPAGALVDDRDPPGFEAANLIATSVPTTAPAPKPASVSASASASVSTSVSASASAARAAAAADDLARARRDAEARRRAADRQRVTAALATARAEVTSRERAVVDARTALAAAEAAVIRARTIADDLAAKLAALADPL